MKYDIVLNSAELKELILRRIDENGLSVLAINNKCSYTRTRGAVINKWMNRAKDARIEHTPRHDEIMEFCTHLGIDIRVQVVYKRDFVFDDDIKGENIVWENLKKPRTS